MNPAATPVAPLACAHLARSNGVRQALRCTASSAKPASGHAYRLALAFRAHVVRWLPLKRVELSDQLDRASISCGLNVAEGAGRSGRDQARHYAIARGILLRLMAVLTALIRR